MDPNLQGLIPENIRQDILSRIGVSDLNEDQKQTALDQVVNNIFTRINYALVEEDIKELENLAKDQDNGLAMKYFLLTKIPNLDKIIQEEIASFKEEPAI